MDTPRRRHDLRVQVRHQRLPRLGLRVPPQQRFRRQQLLQQRRSGIPISIYKQNDFGATVGGPVWIPKIYNGKDKTFFFFSYEGFRNRTGANGSTFTVPTPEMYNGDFSKLVTSAGTLIPIYNPISQVHERGWHRHPPSHSRAT